MMKYKTIFLTSKDAHIYLESFQICILSEKNWVFRAAVTISLRSVQLPARHPLSFESFVLFLLCHFWLRWFSLNVNWFLLSWRHEDVRCDVCDQVLLRFGSLHFMHFFHHLLLTHSGCCRQSDLSPVL